VIEESPLIEIYCNCHKMMEENLDMTTPTTTHADPNITKTLKKMLMDCNEHHPNEYIAGRGTTYSVPDMLDKGENIMYSTTSLVVHDEEAEVMEQRAVDAEDLFDNI